MNVFCDRDFLQQRFGFSQKLGIFVYLSKYLVKFYLLRELIIYREKTNTLCFKTICGSQRPLKVKV